MTTSEQGTIETVLAEVGQALLPLRAALSSADAFAGFVQELGWQVSAIPQPLTGVAAAVTTLYDALRRLLGDGGLNLGGGLGNPRQARFSPDEVARTLTAVQGVVSGIRAVSAAPASQFPPALVADNFPALFPGQLLDHLIITYLQRFRPRLAFALRAFGVIKATYTPPAGNRPAYTRLSLDVADLPRVLSDPSQVLRNAFGWGTADFDFSAFASQVDNLVSTLGVDVRAEAVVAGTAEAVRGLPGEPGDAPVGALRGVVFTRSDANTSMSADIRLIEVPSDPPGFALLPSFDGVLGFRFELGPDITVTIRSDLDLNGGIGIVVRPGRGVDMILGFESDAGVPVHDTGAIEVLAERTGEGKEPVLVLGKPGGTRLEFTTVAGTGGVRLDGDDVDPFAEFELKGLKFVFRPDDADGFIGALLPADGFSVGGDLAVGVSHRNGFYFRGTSNLEIQIPARERIGPVEVQGFTVSAAPSGGDLPISLGASFKATLGPITAVVDRIGLTAVISGKPNHDGNLGPVDVSLGFKPPAGAGLSIDVGVVAGGGFLSYDPARGEYAGAMALEFAGFLELQAIGLISTRMPDGSSGFSLLAVITAEFGTGIQLGLGFTLQAVGGLIGLNRGMNLQALSQGVQTGAIETVMFPRDVIANAPRILSDLNAFFPPEQGTFLIGPMAKIAWGTPPLVTLSLALVIEVPGNIAVLGVLRAILPSPRLPLVTIQVAFAGALEPDKNRLWFSARLFDSNVLGLPLDGGMGLLVAWGDNQDLIITVGGFHPSYRPPQLPFAVPDRLAVDLLNDDGQLIRLSGYFAITSNTIQFGGDLHIKLGFDDFGIEGHLGVDALFQRSPFRFSGASRGSLSLKAFGVGLFHIDLRFQLEGPSPYHAKGRGSIGFLFFEISADFDLTWSDPITTTLPSILVLPLLAGEIVKPEGWQTHLPTGSGKSLVTLRRLPDSDDLVLHPLGTLTIRQRALPLNVRIDRVGGQVAADGRQFSVDPVVGSGLRRLSVPGDKFAMGQFQDLSDADRLSRPGYETQDAGLELGADGTALKTARVVRRSARYELHVVDSGAPAGPRAARRRTALAAGGGAAPVTRFHDINGALFDQLLSGSSTSRGPLSQREASLRQPFPADETVTVGDQRFVVAYVRSNIQAFPPATFRSQAAAAGALAGFVAADPALDGRLHVIPAAEAAAPPAVPDTWTDAGTLPAPASGVDAVVLGSGRVLIAGVTTALFDPTGNSWSAGPAPTTARELHTTTLLGDGRVLIAGGRDVDGTALDSAELYDPATNAWSRLPGRLGSARFGHTATVITGGRVLVAGGTGASGSALDTVELFDPDARSWSPAEPMLDARSGHRAVPLDAGRVLVVGGARPTGEGDAAALAYCEVYAVGPGTWSATGSLATARKGHQATPLGAGRVLVTGGDAVTASDGTYDPHSLATAELFDPHDGTWSPAAPMPGGRTGHRGLLTGSGLVLVLGGTGGPEQTAGFRYVAAYDPAGDRWTTRAGMRTGRSAFAIAELADTRVLVAGGVAASGAGAPGPDFSDPATTAEALIP
ncbi:DUF6603 domain-containing protein [Actinoplanes sp. NPDC051411]|uniref:DUF6603 domain-containing protein n=1 Tax=Actinoplanes sp. NPDC051411 TaxID=3155522 RepID=UPI00343547EF